MHLESPRGTWELDWERVRLIPSHYSVTVVNSSGSEAGGIPSVISVVLRPLSHCLLASEYERFPRPPGRRQLWAGLFLDLEVIPTSRMTGLHSGTLNRSTRLVTLMNEYPSLTKFQHVPSAEWYG